MRMWALKAILRLYRARLGLLLQDILLLQRRSCHRRRVYQSALIPRAPAALTPWVTIYTNIWCSTYPGHSVGVESGCTIGRELAFRPGCTTTFDPASPSAQPSTPSLLTYIDIPSSSQCTQNSSRQARDWVPCMRDPSFPPQALVQYPPCSRRPMPQRSLLKFSATSGVFSLVPVLALACARPLVTLYARCEPDLNSSTGPVPIMFSMDPLPPLQGRMAHSGGTAPPSMTPTSPIRAATVPAPIRRSSAAPAAGGPLRGVPPPSSAKDTSPNPSADLTGTSPLRLPRRSATTLAGVQEPIASSGAPAAPLLRPNFVPQVGAYPTKVKVIFGLWGSW
ncbi:hypothetical protein EDD22DRAFT_85736 [Suillus occidentalis]|nr:hypothetical protein EDD22DRAFT_85736 [Suillus occidentalis]